jgi:hypothetical protein
MWHIVLSNKADQSDMEAYNVEIERWIVGTKAHRNAAAYEENLVGIRKDLSKPSKFTQFLRIDDDFGAAHVLSKVAKTSKKVDLSEIIKHPISINNDPMWVLLSWAADTIGDGEITLTAAYGLLISLYAGYGFISDEPSLMEKYSLEKVKANKALALERPSHATMTMRPEAKAKAVISFPKGVAWE